MRKIARVKKPGADARWVILHETEQGVYLFPFATDEDGSGTGDDWYPTLADAESACAQRYGIGPSDWRTIADPLPGCQQDWITPVRVPGRAGGRPHWGRLERLEGDEWVPLRHNDPRPSIETAIRCAEERG